MTGYLNRRGRLFTLIACLLMIAPTPGHAASPAVDTAHTQATFSVRDGAVSMSTGPGGSSLYLEFGETSLSANGARYPVNAENLHQLTVYEHRALRGSWAVTAALGAFTTVDAAAPPSQQSFQASLHFAGGALSGSAGSTDGVIATPASLVSAGAPATVLYATDGSHAPGDYTLSWTNDDIDIVIDPAAWPQIGPYAYTARLVWTLQVGP